MNQINRNLVCSVLFKDGQETRNIFDIEGDKPNDNSLYIVKINTGHADKQDVKREFCLQSTYHSRQDNQGLVQVHHKRSRQYFGINHQIPLGQRNWPLSDFHLGGILQNYPKKIPYNNDIILKENPKYFTDYHYVFYVGEKGLNKYLSGENLFLIHTYRLPLINIKTPVGIAVTIMTDRLEDIQSITSKSTTN